MESSQPLAVALLTVSDTRAEDTDHSGAYLMQALAGVGHSLAARDRVADDIYCIRAVVAAWIADASVQAVITTGGTGFTARDGTPEAIRPLLDIEIEGFGELFRQLSYQEIRSSTLQSRAVAGLANRTIVACLPGSTGACRTAFEGILRQQLDARHRPCNLAELVIQGHH